jgi:hypothetical protein
MYGRPLLLSNHLQRLPANSTVMLQFTGQNVGARECTNETPRFFTSGENDAVLSLSTMSLAE